MYTRGRTLARAKITRSGTNANDNGEKQQFFGELRLHDRDDDDGDDDGGYRQE